MNTLCAENNFNSFRLNKLTAFCKKKVEGLKKKRFFLSLCGNHIIFITLIMIDRWIKFFILF